MSTDSSDTTAETESDVNIEVGDDKNNTPEDWVEPIARAVGGFDCDVCASSSSNLAEHNIRNTGGLEADWSKYDKIWCNHPYARGQPAKWLAKAAESDCETIVTLSKGDPSTNWFHDHLLKADLLCFPNKRIKFRGEDNSAKFPNVYGVFGEVPDELREWFHKVGWVVENPGERLEEMDTEKLIMMVYRIIEILEERDVDAFDIDRGVAEW